MRLQNKVAIITGGVSGIGLAAVKRFTEEGAQVVVIDNDESGTQLVDNFPNIKFYQASVSDELQVLTVINDVFETFGRIDILVNNAGMTRDAMLQNVIEDHIDAVFDVNVKGVIYCTKLVAPIMAKQGGGRIINTASVVGVYGNIGQTSYAASKAAVIGMTKTWAKELGRKGITVNAVAPGFIQTAMTEKLPANVTERLRQMIALGQLGEAEDVANPYVFLASDEAKYITGHTLHVDGGMA